MICAPDTRACQPQTRRSYGTTAWPALLRKPDRIAPLVATEKAQARREAGVTETRRCNRSQADDAADALPPARRRYSPSVAQKPQSAAKLSQ